MLRCSCSQCIERRYRIMGLYSVELVVSVQDTPLNDGHVDGI